MAMERRKLCKKSISVLKKKKKDNLSFYRENQIQVLRIQKEMSYVLINLGRRDQIGIVFSCNNLWCKKAALNYAIFFPFFSCSVFTNEII